MIRPSTTIAAATLALLLAGCADEEPPPPEPVVSPLHYEYLTPLRLNAGSVVVENLSAPLGAADVAAQSPVTLVQAATQMAHDRLFPGGLTGTATFFIDQASIIRGPNGVLDGLLAVHLVITDAAGQQIAFAAARVGRQHVPGSDPENLHAQLYDMTKQIMDGMNVELEYQIRRSMKGFLMGAPSLPAPVSAVPLSPETPPAPPAPPPGPDISGAHVDPAPGAPPEQMSPPPGFLQPPPGNSP